MNNFLEGNAIDSIYLWRASGAPDNLRGDALNAFSLDESDFCRKNELMDEKLFVVESSSDATIHALVRQGNFAVGTRGKSALPKFLPANP